MAGVNFRRTYQLGEEYEGIKERAIQILGKYLGYPDLITFNDTDRTVTFFTEKLVPAASTNRPRVMLLFSNPHPHSVYQGMFLSPNTRGRENLFWPVMSDAGWLPIPITDRNPKRLADICINAKYPGPFELVFYCCYAFPTIYPEDITKIFGREYFKKSIEPDAVGEFRQAIHDTPVQAVVVFNKKIFNLVSEDQVDTYIDRLADGELIQSRLAGIDRYVPIFLTFPTGWRYRKQYRQFRKASLVSIKNAICTG